MNKTFSENVFTNIVLHCISDNRATFYFQRLTTQCTITVQRITTFRTTTCLRMTILWESYYRDAVTATGRREIQSTRSRKRNPTANPLPSDT